MSFLDGLFQGLGVGGHQVRDDCAVKPVSYFHDEGLVSRQDTEELKKFLKEQGLEEAYEPLTRIGVRSPKDIPELEESDVHHMPLQIVPKKKLLKILQSAKQMVGLRCLT